MMEDDNDEEEKFSLEGTKTKFGRKVHRPAQFDLIDSSNSGSTILSLGLGIDFEL